MKLFALSLFSLFLLGCDQNRVPQAPHTDESDTRSLMKTGKSAEDAAAAREAPANPSPGPETTQR